MGSKGGGSAPSESTVTQTNLPEYAEPFYRDLLGRVGYESAVPYDTYQGSRLQYFDPAEQEAMNRFNQLGVSGTPAELDAAGSIAAQIGTGNPYAETMLEVTRRQQEMPGYASTFRQGNVYSGYDPSQIGQTYMAGQRQIGYDPGTLANRSTLESYENPYQQMVTDRQKEEARRDSAIMDQNIGLQSAQVGGLGGYREAIMQAERQRNLEDQLGDIQAQGSMGGFQSAQAAFEADRAARGQREQFSQGQFGANEANRQSQMQMNLAAYNANQQARQQAASLGLNANQIEQAGRMSEEEARRNAHQMNLNQAAQAAQMGQSAYSQLLGGDAQRMAAAGLMGDFVQQRQAMEMERLRAMQASGQINRELLQRGLDIGYTDFLRQQAFPKEQLSFYSSMLQGVPVAPGQISQAYGMTPSTTQQLLGSGIAGVGLYNALMGG